MIGSTVLTMPWGVQQSGLIMAIGNFKLGQIIFVGLLAWYTCYLTNKYCEMFDEDDIINLILRMWGTKGQKVTLIMSCSVLVGATMAFNVLMNSSFFNILKGLSVWFTGHEISSCDDCWEDFSARYTPFILMGLLVIVLNFKDKATYIKLNSGGIFFVIAILIFLVCVGIRALIINTFTLEHESNSGNIGCHDDWNCLHHNRKVQISLYEPNFFMLSGILTLSYFLHNCIAIIMKNNENHKNNSRDLALGYMASGLSYLTIAVIGYFGFKGNGFPQDQISQNALDMFAPTNPLAFIFRIILFTQMFTVYPMVLYFVRTQFFGFIYGTDYPSKKHVFIMSIVCSSLTTIISSIYPKVGTIVGIVGAFCGLYFVYVIPVCLHIYYSKPTPDDALSTPNQSTMKVAMNDEEMLGKRKKHTSKFRWQVDSALHSLIIVFGLVVVVFQFYKT